MRRHGDHPGVEETTYEAINTFRHSTGVVSKLPCSLKILGRRRKPPPLIVTVAWPSTHTTAARTTDIVAMTNEQSLHSFREDLGCCCSTLAQAEGEACVRATTEPDCWLARYFSAVSSRKNSDRDLGSLTESVVY